jgi:uncharacterized protein HemY
MISFEVHFRRVHGYKMVATYCETKPGNALLYYSQIRLRIHLETIAFIIILCIVMLRLLYANLILLRFLTKFEYIINIYYILLHD